MRGFQFAVDEFLANGTPSQLGAQADRHAFPGVKAERLRNEQRRSINKWNIANPECSDQWRAPPGGRSWRRPCV